MAFSLRALVPTMVFAIAPSLQTSVPVSTIESYSTVYSDVTPVVTATSATQTGCPTVTLTSSICSTCVTPACVELEAITQSCGCPSAIPTVFVDFPCDSSCAGLGCAADYVFFTANCSEPTSTTGAAGGSSSNTTTTMSASGTGVGANDTSTATGVNGTVTSVTSTSRVSGSSTTARTSLASTASVAMAGRIGPFWMGWI